MSIDNFVNTKKRALQINRTLKKSFPDARIILKYSNNWELLVAVILSAQCTDVMVNRVTEKLFKKYKTINDYIRANPRQFENDIRSSGFFRNKTKNILGAARYIQEKYHGIIPRTMDEILTTPGVARKTANVVLGNAYGVVNGVAVDTHVKRFAGYCGLSQHNDPNKIEQDLMKLFSKKDWFNLTYMIIDHGRSWRKNKKSHISCDVCTLCPRFLKYDLL